MKYKQQLAQLNTKHSTLIPNIISANLCAHAIQELESTSEDSKIESLCQKHIEQFAEQIFLPEINEFLYSYFAEGFEWKWPSFDIVDDTALETYYSTTWHCDGCPDKALKLFLYLNPVSEHGCNTLMIDPARTKALRKAGALPLELDKRFTDVSHFLQQAGLSTEATSNALTAGDILIFSPGLLAHRCLPPKPGKKRYTISYTIYPQSFFG